MSAFAPVVSINQLKAVMDQGIADGTLQPVEAPLEHYRAGDLYGRRVYVPAGTTIVTKVHKTEHLTVALKGRCTVFNESGAQVEIIAPQVFVTEPGTYRAIYAHDDVEWFTAHICPEIPLEAVERYIACDTMEEYEALQLETKV